MGYFKSSLLSGAAVLLTTVSGQSVPYCDPLTQICYSSYTNDLGVSYRIALPNVTAAPFDTILQIVAPRSIGWAGIAWAGSMTYNPLTVSWANGANSVVSSRRALSWTVPQPYEGATYTLLKGSGANETHFTVTAHCRGCSQWFNVNNDLVSLDPSGTARLGFALSTQPVTDPASNTSAFGIHSSIGNWQHDLALGKSDLFETWVAENQLPPGPGPTTTVTTTATASPTSTAAPPNPDVPTCSGVPNPRFPLKVADGWKALKIAGNLKTPRNLKFDSQGRLVVVENGKGVSIHELGGDGCLTSSKMLLDQTNLNHGLYFSPDGATLYASSATTVWKWKYDAASGAVVGNGTIVVKAMNDKGHITRTLIIPSNNPNLLVVSQGSEPNIDLPTIDIKVARATVKVFDMAAAPEGGYDYATGGHFAGYGLRNEVGLEFDGNNMLWGVENSADNLNRTIDGNTVDVHNDNPAEELNFIGDVSKDNRQWYGYPSCFTVWKPSDFKDTTFAVGDQFVQEPSESSNDTTCKELSKPPILTFPAHTAPLDAKFNKDFSSLFVSLHGSWNRENPIGFKLIEVPFTKDGEGNYRPVANLDSTTGFKDVLSAPELTGCSFTNCFRPVGLATDKAGRMLVTSDNPREGEIFLLTKVAGSSTVV